MGYFAHTCHRDVCYEEREREREGFFSLEMNKELSCAQRCNDGGVLSQEFVPDRGAHAMPARDQPFPEAAAVLHIKTDFSLIRLTFISTTTITTTTTASKPVVRLHCPSGCADTRTMMLICPFFSVANLSDLGRC